MSRWRALGKIDYLYFGATTILKKKKAWGEKYDTDEKEGRTSRAATLEVLAEANSFFGMFLSCTLSEALIVPIRSIVYWRNPFVS